MSERKKAAVFLFDDVEECEALLVVDLLRRANIVVDMISLHPEVEIVGSHNIKISADMILDESKLDVYDILILPGGAGAKVYKENSKLCTALKVQAAKNAYIAAICAAPYILAELGILLEKPATCYPGVKEVLLENGVMYVDQAVTIADKVITGQALGSAIPFAAAIISKLLSQAEADKVLSSIYYS